MELKELLGKTLTEATGKNGDDEIIFKTAEGKTYKMYHSQDCCESVRVEDICGDMADLVGSPITQADEETNDKYPEGYKRDYPPESMTWTFYRLATAKGQVVIRWLGESNGYYSESVDFAEVCECCGGVGSISYNPNLNPNAFPATASAECMHCYGTGSVEQAKPPPTTQT